MAFSVNEHLSKLKNKDYLEVKWRMVWFREQCPQGTIETEMLRLDSEKGLAVFKAIVTDGNGGIGQGHGSETAKDFGDFIEKAETKAIGRALATLGYGTQFAPELDEGARLVDSPVERTKAAPPSSPDVPDVAALKALCDEVIGPGKWGAVRAYVVDPAKHGDIPDDALSQEMRGAIHKALLAKQAAKREKASAGAGR